MKLMLIDDHELFARSLEITLQDYVEEIKCFSRIPCLRKALEISLPDILLVDIRLGDHSGLELAWELLQAYPQLQIVFLSGFDAAHSHSQALNMGARGFINKNTSIDKLVRQLHQITQGEKVFPVIEHQPILLSPREVEILRLAARGVIQTQIAASLGISRRTVNNHLQNIQSKFKVASTIESIVKSIEMGIL